MRGIQIFLISALIITATLQYSRLVNLDSSTTASVTNFRKDLGSCACDLTNTCDNFCCCDSACDAGLKTIWEQSSWCKVSAVEIEKYCSELSKEGYSSFEDLGCIMYSNRASIGNFHDLPQTNNLVYTSANKFEYHHTNAPLITYGATTPSKYSENSIIQLKLDGTQENFQIWKPSAGSGCAKGYAELVDESEEYQCTYAVNQESCPKINEDLVASALQICQLAGCDTFINNAGSVSASTYSAGVCQGAITSVDFSYTLGYENGQYKLTSGSIVFTTGNVEGKTQISTKITVTKDGVEKSGNPGYIIGTSVLQYRTGSIKEIANSADRNCLTTEGAELNLNFGVNKTWSCVAGTNPCGVSYYVDSLASQSVSLRKYATGSEEVKIVGLKENTCSKQSVTLNIVYSKVGWVMDPQYYIVGAIYTDSLGSEATWTTKTFSVKWLYADPSLIEAPPTNNFYAYFSLLWSPLQQKYSEYLGSPTFSFSILSMVALLFFITIS